MLFGLNQLQKIIGAVFKLNVHYKNEIFEEMMKNMIFMKKFFTLSKILLQIYK